METCDGEDLSCLLYGGDSPVREVAVTEFAWSKSLRKGDYRFVYYPKEMFASEWPEGFGELYNVKDDPWEMKNLYFEPGYHGKVEELTLEFLNFLVVTARPATVHPMPPEAGPQRTVRYMKDWNADNKVYSE